MIAVFDLETTKLMESIGTDINLQPYIVEICVIRLNRWLEISDEYEQRIKPPVSIDPASTKVHGITDADVERKPSFAECYRDISKIFFGCHTVVAHNATFDIGVLHTELVRIRKETAFPFPPIHL